MAQIEKVIKLGVDTKDAVQSVKALENQVGSLQDELKDLGNQKNGLDKLDDNSRKASESLGKVEKSAGKVGFSLKSMAGSIAAGVSVAGLLSKGFDVLSSALMKNETVSKGVETIMKALEIVMSQVVDIIVKSYEEVAKTTNGFDALGKVIKGFITISLTPLKVAFFGIKLAVTEFQLLWEKSIFGSGDVKKIGELTKSLIETQASIKEVGEDALNAGKDIVQNIVPAITSVVDFTEKVIDGVSKVSVKGALEQAKAIEQAQRAAAIAAEQSNILVQKYEAEAEKLRQLRDNDLIAIEDRKKANEDLAGVLDKLEGAMQMKASADLKLAQLNLQAVKNTANETAVLKALGAQAQVTADIEGKRSEQKQNAVNLTKEEIELNLAVIESENNRVKIQQDFTNDLIKNDIERLTAKKSALKQEQDAELKLLEEKKNLFAEGTKARVDAENEYLNKKQEFDNNILKTDAELQTKRKEAENRSRLATIEARLINNTNDIDAQRAFIEEQRTQELQNVNLTEEEKLKIIAKYNQQEKAIDRDLNQKKIDGVKNALSAIGSLAELFAGKSKKSQERAFKVQQGVAIASAVVNTAESAVKAFNSLAGIPIVGPVLGGAAAAAAVAAGLLQIKKIKEQKFDGGGSEPTSPTTPSLNVPDGGGGGVPQAPRLPPLFNLGGQQIGGAGTLLGNNILPQNQQPIKVYVTESDITKTQEKVKTIQGNSNFGNPG